MKKATTTLLAASVAAVSALALTAPAHAYDVDAYEYAAGHMLQSSDIPAALGSFGPQMSFVATSDDGPIYLCYVGKTSHKAPGGTYVYTASFSEPIKVADPNNLMQSVHQYPSAAKAISAFEKLTTRITACTGKTTNSWENADGSTATSLTVTTNGKVPMVTEVGAESVFVNVNVLQYSDRVEDRYSSDTYAVYTLLNDTIISTEFTTNSTDNLSTKDRKKVNAVAFTAVDRWLG